MYAQASVPQGILTESTIRETLAQGLENRFHDQRVLVLIPDHTRTVPLPLLFRLLIEILHDARRIDVMVALGTHLPLDDDALNALVGITPDERAGRYQHVRLLMTDAGNRRQRLNGIRHLLLEVGHGDFFRHDIYLPTSELVSQPGILATLPNGQRKLILTDYELHAFGFFIHFERFDLSRLKRQCGGNKLPHVGRPLDDIYLLVV